ncbi:MAG TPA: hypothetical protein VKU19_22525 [Bryobacteraceae bacterium]|nr:hypothetical protein [Bryobacteraceae bacterium]
MDQEKPDEALSGRPIAKRVIAKLKRHQRGKVVDIKNVIGCRAMAEKLQKTVVSEKELAGFDPAHAAYVYTQNQVSVMSEQLTTLQEMAPFADIISRAEDLYMPSGPPMSPSEISEENGWKAPAFLRQK